MLRLYSPSVLLNTIVLNKNKTMNYDKSLILSLVGLITDICTYGCEAEISAAIM